MWIMSCRCIGVDLSCEYSIEYVALLEYRLICSTVLAATLGWSRSFSMLMSIKVTQSPIERNSVSGSILQALAALNSAVESHISSRRDPTRRYAHSIEKATTLRTAHDLPPNSTRSHVDIRLAQHIYPDVANSTSWLIDEVQRQVQIISGSCLYLLLQRRMIQQLMRRDGD